MNIRTNLRTWRKDARFIIQVGLRGSKTNPHIYAEIKAIAVDSMSEYMLLSELGKFIAEDKLYTIRNESNPQRAVDKAIELFNEKDLLEND